MYFLISKIAFLLLVAMLIGVVAGWLFFGKPAVRTEETDAVGEVSDSGTTAQLAALREELTARQEDVARLRGKLRRAAAELEKRASQVSTARRAHAEVSAHVVDLEAHSAMLDGERVRLQGLVDESAANPTLWASQTNDRQIEEAVSAKVGPLQAAIADATARFEHAERLLAESEQHSTESESKATASQERLVETEHQVQLLDRSLAETESRLREAEQTLRTMDEALPALRRRAEDAEALSEQIRAEAEFERVATEQRIAELKLDVSAGRLRLDAAANELSSLADGLTNASQESALRARELNARLQTLAGQVGVVHATVSGVNASPQRNVLASGDISYASDVSDVARSDLASLPGMTSDLLEHMREFNVQSLREIAAWSSAVVSQYEDWLPDYPGVISKNDWVGYATRATSNGPLPDSTPLT